MYYESILSNIDSLNSQYQEYDLEILNSINDKNIILDLFEIMTNKTFLSSPHHIQDINLISQATDQQIRNLLIRKATDELSIKNPNHEYDMNYISKLNIKKIDAEIYHLMIGYLFNYNNTKDHIDVLEKLSKGKKVKKHDEIFEHIINIEQDLDDEFVDDEYLTKTKTSVLTRIKKLLKK